MLAATFRRYIHDTALKQFEQGLLDSFPRHIPCDGGIVALPRYLVDLINEDYAPLRKIHIIVSLLENSGQYALHILPHITGFSEDRGIHNSERNIKKSCYSLGHQCLASTGRSNHQYIGLLYVDIGIPGIDIIVDPLVMIVDSHRQQLLRPFLTDHILVEIILDLLRLHQVRDLAMLRCGAKPCLLDVLVTSLDTVYAYTRIYAAQERDFILAPAAEHTVLLLVIVFPACHYLFFFLTTISSIIPYSLASAEVIQ